jgi:excisionase family DNA binding protein
VSLVKGTPEERQVQVSNQFQERLITTQEASSLLGKNSAWLRANRADLGIPAYKVGKQYRFKRTEISLWLEKNATGTEI